MSHLVYSLLDLVAGALFGNSGNIGTLSGDTTVTIVYTFPSPACNSILLGVTALLPRTASCSSLCHHMLDLPFVQTV